MHLLVTHNAGFFSCCSVRLERIIAYFNDTGTLPISIDSSRQFKWYKPDIANSDSFDMSTLYFRRADAQHVTETCRKILSYRGYFFNNSDPTLPDVQFGVYREALDFHVLKPLMELYFQPSEYVMHIQQQLERFYDLQDLSTRWCAVFYRGNDKSKEMVLPSYKEFITKMQEVQQKDPDMSFLVQSDETEFLETVLQHFPEKCRVFHKHTRHMRRDCTVSVDHVNMEKNFYYSLRFLSIILILSRCRSIICTSGNCAMWLCLYRGSSDGVHHHHNGRWQ